MRARIIHTKFYESERVLSLSTLSRWLYMYYLTCSGIGLTGAFKWSDSKTMFETAIKPKDLQQCKNELTASNLVFYHDSWVVIPETSEKTGYNNGDNLTSKAFTKEFESLPDEIKQLLNPPSRGIQGGYIPQEIRNKKSEIEKGIVKGNYSSLKDLTDVEFSEIAQEYSISVTTVKKKYSDLVNYCQSKGKKYKNYLATLRAWISKDLEAGKLHKIVVFTPPSLPDISPEEQVKVQELMRQKRAIGVLNK